MADFVSKNFDLIITVIAIVLVLSLVKKASKFITSGVLTIFFLLRMLGITPDMQELSEMLKETGTAFLPQIGNFLSSVVRLIYDFLMTLTGQIPH